MSTAPHCAHWIARKQRFCSSTVTQTGEVYCSQHTPEALSEARARSAANSAACSIHENVLPQLKYRRLESQHRANRATLPLPDVAWRSPPLPVHLDVGCARGRWVLNLACDQHAPGCRADHVGVEIRADIAQAANELAEQRGVAARVRYAACDMAVESPERRALFAALSSQLAVVSILFPDPYRKPPRGRTLTRSLARAIAAALQPGGVVFVASDKELVGQDMRAVLEDVTADGDDGSTVPCFARVNSDSAAAARLAAALGHAPKDDAGSSGGGDGGGNASASIAPEPSSDGWLGRNVWGKPTEREVCCEQPDRHGAPRSVFRALYLRVPTRPPRADSEAGDFRPRDAETGAAPTRHDTTDRP